MRKEPGKRISFLCQGKIYPYGATKPTTGIPVVGFVMPALSVKYQYASKEVLYLTRSPPAMTALEAQRILINALRRVENVKED